MKGLIFSGVVSLASICSTSAYAGAYIPADPLSNRIKDQFIVVLNGDMPSVQARQSALQRLLSKDEKITQVYSTVLKGGAVVMPEARARALANNPNVDYVEEDSEVQGSAFYQSNPTWGLDRIDQKNLPLDSLYGALYTGSGVTAYIIDTGIYTAHPDFGGRASVGTDVVGDGMAGIDCNGHGTHVSGTVGGTAYGVAKQVSLVAVRVLGCNGSGSTSGVIAGLDWLGKNRVLPAVANMSLGGGASTSLDTAVKNTIATGVTMAVAAGNSNADACRYSPARVPAALTVGATTSMDARAAYSNYGSCLDLFAPGSAITSDWLASGTNTISGTSMATPHVTGSAALYLQGHPSASPSAVSSAIVSQTTSGKVTSAGAKSPNKLLYSLLP
jgi:subtilisin family serine protease